MESPQLEKLPTGIEGFEDLSLGGLPKGRTTLISGTPGAGKTVMAVEYLYRGITEFRQNGVFVTCEEDPQDIVSNVMSFGWDINSLVAKKKWVFVDLSPRGEDEAKVGAYDLGAMTARVIHALEKVNAKRVAIDSSSALFERYQESGIIRRELLKLITAMKKTGATTIITTERVEGASSISKFGVEEFVTDNVILLSNKEEDLRRTRQIEILKFRGAAHLTGKYPMLITPQGVRVFPLSTEIITGELLLE